MIQPKFEEDIMTCPVCEGQRFWIQFREVVSHKLNALDGADGWLETESLEGDGPDPILGIVCYDCDNDLEVTTEAEAFIRKIGG